LAAIGHHVVVAVLLSAHLLHPLLLLLHAPLLSHDVS
jgi:hypothetical protein